MEELEPTWAGWTDRPESDSKCGRCGEFLADRCLGLGGMGKAVFVCLVCAQTLRKFPAVGQALERLRDSRGNGFAKRRARP